MRRFDRTQNHKVTGLGTMPISSVDLGVFCTWASCQAREGLWPCWRSPPLFSWKFLSTWPPSHCYAGGMSANAQWRWGRVL